MSTRREVLKNNPATTLASGIANGTATSVSVSDGSVFPSTGDFRVIVDNEIMLVTARSTNTLTVVRGQEGTTGVAHSSGAAVTQILTAAAMKQYSRDNNPDFDGSRPPFRIMDSSGNTLTSSDFTTVNLSTSTITDSEGKIHIRKAGNSAVGENITALARSKSAPATTIASAKLCYPIHASSAIPALVVGFRESSTGKMFVHAILNNNAYDYQILKYTSPTTSPTTANTRTVLISDGLWLKCQDDNTNLIFSVSHDGVNWVQIYSEARTTFMTGGPDQFVWGANNFGNNYETVTSLTHWSEG